MKGCGLVLCLDGALSFVCARRAVALGGTRNDVNYIHSGRVVYMEFRRN